MSYQEHKHEAYVMHECDGNGHEHHHHSDGSCCCEHHAQEFHGIETPVLIRLIAAAALYLCGMLLPVGETAEALLMIVSALLSGYDVILTAGKTLIKRHFFDECFLMTFAAIAACVIGEFEEGAAVFLLYRIGDFCQRYAIRHSKKTISSLTGECTIDPADQPSNQFITRFARVYTPIILILAVLTAVLLPLVGKAALHDSVYRALTFLVLACPCAIVISVPLTYCAGIAAASRRGVYFRDSTAVDTVAKHRGDQLSLKNVSIKYKTAYIYSRSGISDAHSSELVLTGDQDAGLALRIARKTHRIALENVIFTIAIKLTVLVLAAFGVSALWFAVFADSGVTVVTVLNSLRAFYVKK